MTQATLRFESARLKSRLASVQLSRRSVLQRLQRVNWEVDEVAFAAVSTFKKIVTENLRNVSFDIAQKSLL